MTARPGQEQQKLVELDRRRKSRWLAVALLLAMLVTEFGGFLFATAQRNAVISIRNETRDMRIAQQAIGDAERGVTDYVMSKREDDLLGFEDALATLAPHRSRTLLELDRVTSPRRHRADAAAAEIVRSLERAWLRQIQLVREGRPGEAALVAQERVRPGIADIRARISRYLAVRNATADRHVERGTAVETILLVLQLVGGAATLLLLLNAFRSSDAEARGRRAAIQEAVAAREQVETLLQMTDMLQSAADHADANAVLHSTANALMPDLGCALYIFNNSRDRLDLSSARNLPSGYRAPDHVSPSGCWAAKRGKSHINLPGAGALRCSHLGEFDGAVLEVPMVARGEVFGLLSVVASGAGAADRVRQVNGIATALAEAMSLTLSNIALREKLRNQALRDPLTGLYNRRYMEDTLDRLAQLSERGGRSFSVIMIDLDHFKRLNDEHGHGVGDAVLRDAAKAVGGALRQSDVPCRYGGEELIVLMPDSGLEDAIAKAETMRGRIESLSAQHGTPVTASFGVAASPENALKPADLVLLADQALYQAKRSGRNRVAAAPRALDLPRYGEALAAE